VRNLKYIFCVPLALVGAIYLIGQTDLTGFWSFKVPTGDGNFRESFFDLKQSGEEITGKLVQGKRETPITSGTFSNGKLYFVISVRGPNGQTREVTYDGSVDGKNIALTSQAPNRGPVQGVMERSTPEAALPPPRLPLPELRDMPDNGLARTPPMGWNSWNKFAGKVDDAAVRGMADAMVSSGMSKVGYQYINIDDTGKALVTVTEISRVIESFRT
jgi:alpha-galactosidase